MKNKNYDNLVNFMTFLVAFIVFTIIIKTIDVRSIGPENSEVGLASINDFIHNTFGYNDLFYNISKYLGYLSFLIIGLYGLVGLKELIQKKSIFKVNNKILLLGAFYVLVLSVYVLFEKVVINYRPVLEDGKLAASYPSSHTILSICVCLSSIMVCKSIFKNKDFVKIFNIGTLILMGLIVITRLLSGVHWFTDIIGAILISLALIYIFKYFIEYKIPRKNKTNNV